ncbi:hypothetical protein [Rhodanobacter koreensis]
MDLWRKLTIDWPCALGDWLWLNLVVAVAIFLGQLTFRRVVLFAGLLILTIAFAQIASIDFAFVFAGDMMFYFEIASAVVIVATRGHVRRAMNVAAQVGHNSLQRLASTLLRRGRRERRKASAVKRTGCSGGTGQSDDEPAVWGCSYAFA